ncbi:MerR family transcriptional regulator [Gehongia tenuis]|uniref:MerR family transcriptional regulator n=1 Tax=Gehongia tenuis TaxID=2763655 RepID=A0A926D2Q0_9FIRM|nr:MerR family transcriptional regulator [Gehongia tenuis]MBC8530663.1 MerR family transcriptional regulator [Gehongia tenuis]
MKEGYTIGEVARMLGLGTETVRFYVKKNLVHPSVMENGYQIFNLYNIQELIEVIYFRNLDVPISQLRSLLERTSPELVNEILQEKKGKIEETIRFQQHLLKKIEYFERERAETEENLGKCILTQIPDSYILYEGEEDEPFYVHNRGRLCPDQVALYNGFRKYRYTPSPEGGLTLSKEGALIVFYRRIARELGITERFRGLATLKAVDTLKLLVHLEEGALREEQLSPLFQRAEELGLRHGSVLYIRRYTSTAYTDPHHFYADIHLPIEK